MPSKTEITQAARQKNGEVVRLAAMVVATNLGLEDEQARSLVQQAMIGSLINPVITSVHAGLSESMIATLSSGQYSEMLVTGNGGGTFDPWAVNFSPVALMQAILPIAEIKLSDDPATLAVAVASLLLGIAALEGQWKHKVTGVDAEIVLIHKHITSHSDSKTVAETTLLHEVNNARSARATPALSQTEFDQALLRLLIQKFITTDSAQKSVTLIC
ncbi:hypothetical protein ABIB38_001474 [Massilia sp. UYP11]|uniref:hypothetical protein n=1 Tax=Massilia sp. UYP11 TaxID=1756385 RepID=UPI003D1B78C7